MHPRGWTVWAAALAAGAGIAAAAGGGDTDLLVRSYFLFRMASQVAGQAVDLGKPAGEEAAAQVAAAAEAWNEARNNAIRAALEQQLRDRSIIAAASAACRELHGQNRKKSHGNEHEEAGR